MSRYLALALLAGCAATTAPAPPPEEQLVVLNAGENSLSVVPVDQTRPVRKIQLGAAATGATDVAARGPSAVVVTADTDELVVVDLRSGVVRRTVALAAGSRPSAVVMISDDVAYVANAGRNTVTRVGLIAGDTASVDVGRYPRAMVLTRGRLFVVNANVAPCAVGTCSLGESWLTVINPQTNARAAGRDSIGLPSQGNASSATLGGDGLIYVVNTGDPGSDVPGRLSIVDPIDRLEVGSFGGFGPVPRAAASDGAERLFVTSVLDGLMEFNTRTRRVVRGAGEAIFVNVNVAVAVDSRGSIYAIELGACAQGQPGRLRVFRRDLTEARNLVVGLCPVAIAAVLLPGLDSGGP